MTRNLGIVPLRSFVALADCGGFQRAATSLHLTQGAVSQHVRRLEESLGRTLVERQGRGSRFTADGEAFLGHARRILSVHDETLREFGVEPGRTLVIGSTEHAAAQLLPELASSLNDTFPHCRIRFRIDRGAQLRSRLTDGRIDLALLLGPAEEPDARTVGELELTWYSAPGWTPPPRGEPVPLVAFDAPCALRTRALDTLAAHGVAAEVGCEAAHLAGVQAAVRAGLGIGLMATLGKSPEGLVARHDLPLAQPLPLSVTPRRGLPADLASGAAESLTRLLATGPASSGPLPLLGAA
ncbi:LysR substrate-binding domain-containing protein [Phytohabitans houttuyneae]|uniref:LysR family transcriptional regulator n=1 Tax=Phytohabitans houttuyneae TaxID=1076126 RepID=A0A6V8KNJ9_9ACTN|nr:LysR substrate-binding domain-containing protein [Phytohabitans houttuyneae]GFJ83347.1 LysR family transcriptional regulator [Phytohabitans houttuyneae]